MVYNIIHDKNPKPEDTHILSEGIANYARLKKGHKPIEHFSFLSVMRLIKLKAAVMVSCITVVYMWINCGLMKYYVIKATVAN